MKHKHCKHWKDKTWPIVNTLLEKPLPIPTNIRVLKSYEVVGLSREARNREIKGLQTISGVCPERYDGFVIDTYTGFHYGYFGGFRVYVDLHLIKSPYQSVVRDVSIRGYVSDNIYDYYRSGLFCDFKFPKQSFISACEDGLHIYNNNGSY